MEEFNKTGKKTGGLRSRNTRRNEGFSNYVFGKVQPQAVPLEEAVLGALMLDKDALAVVLDILQPESFYLDGHQVIYKAMLRLFEHSKPVDLLTVTEELKRSNELETAGGPHYLVELTDKIASAANIEYHARIIAQKHIQRELIRLSTNTINSAYEDATDVFDLLDEAERGLFSIAQQNMNRSYESMGSLASKLQRQLEELKQREDGLTGVPTGFTDLDRLTSGWQPSDLVIVAARPGMGKCLGKGTRVLTYAGHLKKIEEVSVGDLLMGDDSTPRRVRSLARGREMMYWIRQSKGIDYRVNESHILSLKRGRQDGNGGGADVLDISVRDLLQRPAAFQTAYKGYKVAVDFPEREVPLAPYFLGLWLGKGASEEAAALADRQVAEAGLIPGAWRGSPAEGSPPSAARNAGEGYSVRVDLRRTGVSDNAHIPAEYLINSTEKRLALLAGLIDSAGRWLPQSDGFAIDLEDEKLIRQVKFLGDSLGYRTSIEPDAARSGAEACESPGFRLLLHGNTGRIPLRIRRKPENAPRNPSDWQLSGIRIEADKVDDYYGFEIDGNGRFLLEDMTVTHNTSFVLSLARNAAVDFGKGVAIFSLEMSSLQLVQRMVSMEAEISGSKMRNGQLEQYEWEQLHAAIERMSDTPIFIDDTPGINVFEVRAKSRRLKMQHDIQLVIIDYLQLMSGGPDNQRGNREQEVSAISRALKGLAKELNVPVIALSQLSRAVEVRGGTKRPQLSDLRESGCLSGDTLIQDAATGMQIPIRELAERTEQAPLNVIGLTADGRLQPHKMIRVFYSGRKMVYQLLTGTGRSIKASANHPFYKADGWTALADLHPGDRIAVSGDPDFGKPAGKGRLSSFGYGGNRPEETRAPAEVVIPAEPAVGRPVWDEVVSITALGVEDVYDATVEGVHNFLANDIVVHNSIEQDADIVSFIYRPEYYQILEDEEGQSLKGVAEIIIAKHRNGALDTVRLRFTDKYARFSDLDEPDFGDLGEAFENPNVNIITRPSRMNDDEDIPF